MSEEQIIRYCAPTLASLKTGSMFSCACASRAELNSFVRDMNHRLMGKGLRVLPLKCKNGSCLIYVYRPERLERDLKCRSAEEMLMNCGYCCKNANCCIRELIARLAQTDDFPHEIGLFLSYPPEDVDGFIHRRGEARCSGYWKVYGDVEAAQRTFARYRKCSRVYMRLWNQGCSIEQLTVAV